MTKSELRINRAGLSELVHLHTTCTSDLNVKDVISTYAYVTIQLTPCTTLLFFIFYKQYLSDVRSDFMARNHRHD